MMSILFLVFTLLTYCVTNALRLPTHVGRKVMMQKSRNIAAAVGISLIAFNQGVAPVCASPIQTTSSIVLSNEMITTDSGLQYEDLVVGESDKVPKPGDTVRVHYTGWLEGFNSEKKFDSSYDRRTPLVFKVGEHKVISGWDEALLTNMKVGSKRNVKIPPNLGYGVRGAGGVIPPNAELYFTMELVGIGAR